MAHTHAQTARHGALSRQMTLLDRIRSYRALQRSRADLAALDAARLADVGLTEEDAGREARRPVWDVPTSWLR